MGCPDRIRCLAQGQRAHRALQRCILDGEHSGRSGEGPKGSSRNKWLICRERGLPLPRSGGGLGRGSSGSRSAPALPTSLPRSSLTPACSCRPQTRELPRLLEQLLRPDPLLVNTKSSWGVPVICFHRGFIWIRLFLYIQPRQIYGGALSPPQTGQIYIHGASK